MSEIEGVVTIENGANSGRVKWNNSSESDKKLIAIGFEKLRLCDEWRINDSKKEDLQVFLLSELMEVRYYKHSKGGMMSSKKYHFVEAANIEGLFNELNGKSWGN